MFGWWHHLDIWRHVSCSQTPIWPTPFCRVNESPSCIPDLWERDHTFEFLCAMSNLSMLKEKGPKGIMILKLSPTILKIYLRMAIPAIPAILWSRSKFPAGLLHCLVFHGAVLDGLLFCAGHGVPLGAGELPPKLQIWKISSLIHSNMYPSMLLGQ